MSVYIDNNCFHLQTDHTSYIFHVMENGELGNLYYGLKIHQKPVYENLATREEHTATPAWKITRPDFQPDLLKQEYASFGKGDFRYPAFQITAADGSRISEFTFKKYELHKQKKRLSDLPSSFDDTNDDASTLTIILMDKVTDVELQLNYVVFPHQDVIIRSAKFINHGSQNLVLNQALSAQLDLPDANYDMMQFSGSWARERQLVRHNLHGGIQSISSLRTASSHQQNPFFMVARTQTTDDNGEVFGFNLIYSGNFLSQVEVDQYNTSRIMIGINPAEFAWNLAPKQSFQTPEAVISYTDQGMNQLSQQMGQFYLQHLVNPHFATAARPILINNWEATYFDFDEAKLMQIVREAKSLGIEMFVLDDGWFGHRNDDTTSLGDWFVDGKKLPLGISHLANQIHGLDMQFGLWFEPEMISRDSKLYQKHPDWLIGAPKRQISPGRNQFVLDMTRPEVVDYLFDAMSKIIRQTKLDYIKWDMNRNITEMFGADLAANAQLEMPHRYILGVYQLYDRLVKAFPAVLFESCASGGGRFDLGMMYYAPQAWTSDDTDAVERMKIQFGTSYGYPQSMMGAHVSAVPNDQTGRITPLKTRGDVAYFGDLGYELDVTKLSNADKTIVKRQIKFYKQYRQLLQYGDFYRLDSPFENDGNVLSWVVVNQAKTVAIGARYQLLNHPNAAYIRLRFRGLDPNQRYTVNQGTEIFYGDELMQVGLFIKRSLDKTMGVAASSDFNSRLFVITAVN